jgi:hypothetical protein
VIPGMPGAFRPVPADDDPCAAFIVMAGHVPAIHVFASARAEDVDGRHKAGHDG